MCGGESRVSIEAADNGFMVDGYKPGDGDKPGKHVRMVATSPEHAVKIALGHMRKVGKKGKRGRGGVIAMPEGAKAGRKKRARKRG